MKLAVRHDKLFRESSIYASTAIRLLLNILLVIIVIGLTVGVFKTGYDVFSSFNKPLEQLLQKLLLDTVFIVALVEITITILGYLRDGRVHVRYIIDTILIVMLNEIITIWFKDPDLEKAIGISIIIAVLSLARIGAVKYSPANETK